MSSTGMQTSRSGIADATPLALMTTTIHGDGGTEREEDPMLRAIHSQAELLGYRVAVLRDDAEILDVLAVPWSKTAGDPGELVRAILRRAQAITGKAELGHQGAPAPLVKAHGRLYFRIDIGDNRQIKLNIVARKPPVVASLAHDGSHE
jgi:hypothetical protein